MFTPCCFPPLQSLHPRMRTYLFFSGQHMSTCNRTMLERTCSLFFFFLQGEACWRWISQNNRSGTLWTEDRQSEEKNRDNVPERERGKKTKAERGRDQDRESQEVFTRMSLLRVFNFAFRCSRSAVFFVFVCTRLRKKKYKYNPSGFIFI